MNGLRASPPPELPEEEDARERMAARAHERALLILTYREHSCRQLYDKLCRAFPPEIAAQTVARLRESDVVSDARFAAQYVREASRKGVAPARIVYELRDRGVDRETADEAVRTVTGETDPSAQIYGFLSRRYGGWPDDPADRRRAYAALLRFGWSPSEIRAALRAQDGSDAADFPD